MLEELRAVPWPLALALLVGGAAVTTIALLLVFGNGGGSAATVKVSSHRRTRAGEAPAAHRRPKREAESPPGERLRHSSLEALVGQRFMVGLFGVDPPAALLADARRGEIGGIVIFPEDASPAETAAAVEKLQGAAREGHNLPLLIATDQEGAVKRFANAPPDGALSELTPGEALTEGKRTAVFLSRHGINVDLAPVVDLGLPGSSMTEEGRTISPSPNGVIRVAVPFAGGLESNVMPVAKHFPGLTGTSDSDSERSVVDSALGSSLAPYEVLIERGVPAIMLSTAIYEKVDSGHGAAWSRKVVDGLLRGRLGFRGLTISDDLSSGGVSESLAIPQAFVESAQAGVDMLMAVDPESFRPAHAAVLRAAEDGQISESNLRSSYRRIIAAKRRFAR